MLLSLLQKHHSVRGFQDKPIPAEDLHYILECGRLSPAGGNEQPWKFGVITDRALIQQLAQAASIHYDQSWITTAPLVIVLCTQTFEGEIGMRRFPSRHERLQAVDRDLYAILDMEEGQVKIPGTHMVLAAQERGIGSTWVSCMDCERVEALLGVHGYHVTNLIAFGYPAKERGLTPKKALDTITFTNHFDHPGLE